MKYAIMNKKELFNSRKMSLIGLLERRQKERLRGLSKKRLQEKMLRGLEGKKWLRSELRGRECK